MIQKKIFRMFANCIPVKGAKRSVICDLQKQSIYFITTDTYDMLVNCAGKDLEQIKRYYPVRYSESINAIFEMLVENELGFYTDSPEEFPDIDLVWDFPGKISNAILERNSSSVYDLPSVIHELNSLGCQYLELRFYQALSIWQLEEILFAIRQTRIRSVILTIGFSEWMINFDFEIFLIKNQRIQNINVHNVPSGSKNEVDRITFIESKMEDNSSCGIVHCRYFSANLEAFSEAMHFNSCLNRKIAVSADGIIRNCPSMRLGFGNVLETSLGKVVETEDFQRAWSVTKDQIDVCRDCEFRYICTDCRAHLVDRNNMYSKPSKCSYDPYTSTWN